MKIPLKVLHIDTEKTWRGGENQIWLYCRESKILEVENHIALNPDSTALQRLDEFATIFPVSMRGGFHPVSAIKIAQYCKKHNIQVIAAQTSNAHAIGLLVKKIYPTIKLFVHRRVDFPMKQGWIHHKKYFSDKIDGFISVSKAVNKILLDYGIEPKKLHIVADAVDEKPYFELNHFSEKEQLCKAFNIDSSQVVFGNASALTHQKGYETLLKAIKRLKDQKLKFHCFIAGDGHLRDSLEQMRMDLQIDSHVTFLGWIKNVSHFLSALDILSMPSNNEGMGSLVQDAVYAGCAVAATNVGGIPEMIIDRETGLLSPVGDDEHFAMQLKNLILDSNLRHDLAQSALDYFRIHFSLKAMVENTTQIYRL